MLTKTDADSSKTKDNSSSSSANACLSYFTPGHLIYRKNRGVKPQKVRHYTTTYISFSPDGQELLQNLGGEHIYMYRLNDHRKPLVFSADSSTHQCDSQQQNKSDQTSCKLTEKNGIGSSTKNGISTTNGLTSTYEMRQQSNVNIHFGSNSEFDDHKLPEKALKLKIEGNDAFSQQNYFQATVCYNKALSIVPDSSVLYANRGAALLKRAW